MLGTRRLWMLLLSVSAAGVIAACAADSTAPVPASADQPDMLLGLPSLGLVRCQPQPYASSTVAIGPAGGVIHVNKHTLTVPAGALNSTVLITMEAPSDTVRSVRFSPEGLTFNASHRPQLEMDYSKCALLTLLPKRIVYTNEQLQVLQWLTSLDLLSLLRLQAYLDHFSRYAVHY